jgi:PleD family two-component response regulator
LFARFQESLDVLNQGTGIGLALCKKLSIIMGAELYLDSNFNSGIDGCPGTRFVLQLNQQPLSSFENGSINGSIGSQLFPSVRDGMHPEVREDLPNNLSVLFVDDDAMLRKMFSRVLKATAPSWTIREASNGETALCLIDDGEKFDVIFVDQYMASVEKQLLGTETVHAMRAKGVESIICGLSANDVENAFMEAGGNYFMYKPFPCKKDALTDELLQMLSSKLDKEQAV